jgi:2-haloacid dehalogenase
VPSPTLTNIAACVFDAYGTLYDFNSAAAKCRDALGAKAAPLSELWRQKQLQYTWLRALMGTYIPFWQLTGDALDHALETLAIGDKSVRERLMSAWLELDPFPEAVPALQQLKKKGIRLGILSNGSPEMLAAAAKSSGLDSVLEVSLSVHSVGIYKPDRRVYQLATEHFKQPASRIAFFSSNAWDAHGGAHFGFQTTWVNRSGQKRERIPGPIAIERSSLADIADAIVPAPAA